MVTSPPPKVCTTVFTPSEYGCVGLTEEQAVAKHGADALDTYLWQWSTLEHQAAHRLKHKSVRADIVDTMPTNCMAKLVCLKAEGGKVSRASEKTLFLDFFKFCSWKPSKQAQKDSMCHLNVIPIQNMEPKIGRKNSKFH